MGNTPNRLAILSCPRNHANLRYEALAARRSRKKNKTYLTSSKCSAPQDFAITYNVMLVQVTFVFCFAEISRKKKSECLGETR
jgi:hypothetical protein